MKATYLLIKSSVLSVTTETKPIKGLYDNTDPEDLHAYERAMLKFMGSFIKVDNPEAFWNQADLPSALRVKMNIREREDGVPIP